MEKFFFMLNQRKMLHRIRKQPMQISLKMEMQNLIFHKPKRSNGFFFSRLVGGAKIIGASDRRFYAFAMLSSDGIRWRE